MVGLEALEEAMVESVMTQVDLLIGERACAGYRGELRVYLCLRMGPQGSALTATIRTPREPFNPPATDRQIDMICYLVSDETAEAHARRVTSRS